MEGNSRKNTINYRRKSRHSGKTKHIILALSAILILTCILAIPLASGKFQVYALPQTNNANPSGGILALGGTTPTINDDGLSFIGNMTVNGNSTLNGNLNISNAQQIILGSPLIANGTLTLTGDKIKLGNSTKSGGTITILGNSTSPAENTVKGNLTVGNKSTGSEVYLNATNYYEYINSSGGGVISDYNNQSNDVPILNNDIIRVTSGQINIYSEDPDITILGGLVHTNYIRIAINHDWFNMTMSATALFITLTPSANIHLWGNSPQGYNYSGQVNVTKFAQNNEFPVIEFLGLDLVDINQVILGMEQTPTEYLTFTPGTVFDSWGPWFAVGDSSGAGGVMIFNDTYVYMNSNSSIRYQFLKNDANAAITLTNSSHYPKAEMNVSTTNQSINGLGNSTIITNGGILQQSGYSDIRNITQITKGSFNFTGSMLVNGNQTIQGNITITGYNKLQAPVTVFGQMDVNNGNMSGTVTLSLPSGGSMETTGTLNITNGLMNITKGTMNMNSTGIFVYGASNTSIGGSITLIGTMNTTGSPTITGNIGLLGYNDLQGSITIQGYMNINNGLTTGTLTLTIASSMETTGTMTITSGAIGITSGSMVMNDAGSFITGSTISVTGDQITSLGTTEINGDVNIQGDIGISGYSYMQGNISIRAPLLSLNSTMVTDGNMTITGGAIGITSGHMVMNDTGSFISGNTITVTGKVDFNGDAAITGDIGISGHNYMQGNISVAQILSLDGKMITNGDMTITGGEIKILSGSMVMNSSGSFIISDAGISVTGTVNFNGDATITGDIGISGYNYMQGLITVDGNMNINNGLTSGNITLTIGSTMSTNGTMNITSGAISIPSGSIMVMNGTGAFITGSTITVTGDQITSQGITEVNGDITMKANTGDIGISGYSNMQGSITVNGNMNINNQTTGEMNLTINGTMSTNGVMNITDGEITVSSGSIVMNNIGAFIQGSTITVNGTQITSQGTITINGDTTIAAVNGGSLTMGNSIIRGQITIPNTLLNINDGSMTGSGTIKVSNGYMQTIGRMIITNGVITEIGTITMSPDGTTIDSITTITSDRIDVWGTVTNAGQVTMSGNFKLLIPMSMTGVIVTSGTAVMGSLGTVNGIMTITGNAIMTGVTMISGVNSIMGSMTVSPGGAIINGGVSLTGSIVTSNTPTLGPSTVITINSGSLNGISVPQMAMPGNTIVSILTNPLILLSLGIMVLGTVYVVARSVYIGWQERRLLVQIPRMVLMIIRNRFARMRQALRRLSGGSRSRTRGTR